MVVCLNVSFDHFENATFPTSGPDRPNSKNSRLWSPMGSASRHFCEDCPEPLRMRAEGLFPNRDLEAFSAPPGSRETPMMDLPLKRTKLCTQLACAAVLSAVQRKPQRGRESLPTPSSAASSVAAACYLLL